MPGNCTLWFRLDELLWRVHFSITSPTALNGPPKPRHLFLIFAMFFCSFGYAALFPIVFLVTFANLRSVSSTELVRFDAFLVLFGAKAVCAQSCSVLGTFEAFPRPRPFWGKTGLFSTIRGLSRAKAVPGPAAPALQERFLNMRRLCADSCPTTTVRGCFFHILLKHIEKYSVQN